MVCVMVEFNTYILLETVPRLQEVDTRKVADSCLLLSHQFAGVLETHSLTSVVLRYSFSGNGD